MPKSSNAQIIPFPLPPYLASYFANKITSSPIITADGSYAKPFSVKRDSAFGSFILRCFSKRERPNFVKEGFTFFIQVQDHQTTQEKNMANGRISFLTLEKNTVKEITKVFKAVFEEALFNYVAGAEEITYEFSNRKRGVQKKAIEQFCEKYKVKYTNQNLCAWQKAIYRDKKTVNHNKMSVL